MTRRTWFRTITGALATLATGLGLRKVEKCNPIKPPWGYTIVTFRDGVWLSTAVWDGERWHFEDVKPEEET